MGEVVQIPTWQTFVKTNALLVAQMPIIQLYNGASFAYSDSMVIPANGRKRLLVSFSTETVRIHGMIRSCANGPYIMKIFAHADPENDGTIPTNPGIHCRNVVCPIESEVILTEDPIIGTGDKGICVIKQRLGPDTSPRELSAEEVSMILGPAAGKSLIQFKNLSSIDLDINWIISWYEHREEEENGG